MRVKKKQRVNASFVYFTYVFLPERENKMCLNHFCKESKVTVDIALIVY